MGMWKCASRAMAFTIAFCLLTGCLTGSRLFAAGPDPAGKASYTERKALYLAVGAATGLPWYDLAAIDQYERTLNTVQKRKPAAPAVAIYYSETEWAGALNPNPQDSSPESIRYFGGKGRDGSGDGMADRANDMDVLYSRAAEILQNGASSDDFRNSLWECYHNSRSVERISQFSRIYSAFGTTELGAHAFPLPLTSTYTYRDTWGASRGWGGRRSHEGTDLFAGYGVPLRSTCYGIIEVMGWNAYGGWRIGVRDLDNVYHYFAHLSGFNKGLKPGTPVKPGQVLGWVGSSGYGKPGTSGKFPPHLHYGLYRDRGLTEWAFDPYPHLRQWEREERLRGKHGG